MTRKSNHYSKLAKFIYALNLRYPMLYLVRDYLFPVLVFLHALLAGRPPNDGHGRFARS